MAVNGVLTTRTLPSPIREALDTYILLNPAHHVIVSRLARRDTMKFNHGDVITRIAVEKLGFIPDAHEDVDNAPMLYRYVKRSYQINRHAGHVEISSKLMDTSVENVAAQSEALLSIAAQETAENEIIKTALRDGKKISCTQGSTSSKVGNLTELSAKDLDDVFTQLMINQIEPCQPMVSWGSDWWGSRPLTSKRFALIVPIDFFKSFREMVRADLAIAVESYSRSDAMQDANQWGTIENFDIYGSTLMRAEKTADGKNIYNSIIVGQDCVAQLDGLMNAESIYQGRSVASKEGSFCSVGKAFYSGSGILRPDGVYVIKHTDFVKP